MEELLFELANALRIPVFAAAIGALVFVLFDLGAFFVEINRRRGNGRREQVQDATKNARQALAVNDGPAAQQALMPLASSAQMADTLATLVDGHDEPGIHDRRAKALADFDLTSLRKLERSRMLVRFGPALGLMGTLIPLSPALEGLAEGDVAQLSENLRAAFSVTVLGLLIGAVAFSISLVRDRLYAQDLSDLEYVVAALDPRAAPVKPVSRSRVNPRASRRGDRGGDPLDGLVNLFDLGIVLAVAFLLAALQSVNLTDLLTQANVTVLRTEADSQTLIVKEGESIKTVKLSKKTVTGSGRRVGEVYRLQDGRLVYVTGADGKAVDPTP